jgi:hypothetical protein
LKHKRIPYFDPLSLNFLQSQIFSKKISNIKLLNDIGILKWKSIELDIEIAIVLLAQALGAKSKNK